jgi:hypothetical protein
MDELTTFASLRPDVSRLSEQDRAAIRESAFGPTAPGETVGSSVRALAPAVVGRVHLDVDLGDDQHRSEPHRQFRGADGREPRQRRRVGLAAAVVAIVGLGGVWAAVANRTQQPPPATQQTDLPADDTVAEPVADPFAPPRVIVDLPGWTLTRASDSSQESPDLVLFDPVRRFDGPWVRVHAEQGIGMSFGGVERTVRVGSVDGTVSGDTDNTLLDWTTPDGHQLWAFAWKLADQTLADLVANVTVGDDGTLTASALPPGFAPADTETAAAMARYVEYQFDHGDGTSVQVTFYAGAQQAFESRVGGDVRTSLAIGDEEFSLLDYGSGRYRANVLRGFWAWEIDGEPFASRDEFADLIAHLRIVDDAAWEASLPAEITGSTTRSETVSALLAGVSLPDGFDTEALLGGDATMDRYQLVAEVSGAVACAWLDIWFDATDAADAAAARLAADALATSRDWAMLSEIDSQGGWSSVVWEWADAVNGGPGVLTGSGPVPPTRDMAASGLGCDRFW